MWWIIWLMLLNSIQNENVMNYSLTTFSPATAWFRALPNEKWELLALYDKIERVMQITNSFPTRNWRKKDADISTLFVTGKCMWWSGILLLIVIMASNCLTHMSYWAFFYNRKWRHADFTARGRQISNPTSYSESPERGRERERERERQTDRQTE